MKEGSDMYEIGQRYIANVRLHDMGPGPCTKTSDSGYEYRLRTASGDELTWNSTSTALMEEGSAEFEISFTILSVRSRVISKKGHMTYDIKNVRLRKNEN